jgi:predicted PurR-regulated permease PerM
MDETASLKPWITFAGAVLIVVVLYWAQAVLVPIALALLISFVLTPPVTWLEKWLGRSVSVIAVVTLVFVILGLAGWGLERQLSNLANDLPGYRVNILRKIADVRGAGKGGTVEKLQETIDDIKTDLGKTDPPPKGKSPQPVVVTSEPAGGVGFSWLSPLLAPLGTASMVIILVITMLFERRTLRDRLVGLIGHGRVSATTRAFDEAGTRVSRQLLMQSLVNAIYGLVAGVGLYYLGTPYALVWGSLAAGLRFVPYIGPVIGAGVPIIISLAAQSGWHQPLLVIGMFTVLELFTNLVLETALYAGAAGVSQVALLVAVAFWTWLWGPLGLLMATPLTVCLVVIGKHVPGLEFLVTLMADTPPLSSDHVYYQRLLARDPSEAADLIDRHIKSEEAASVYDALLLPALNYAERDRLEGRLSVEEETAVIDATRELMNDAAPSNASNDAAVTSIDLKPEVAAIRVLGYPANGAPDELALNMLAQAVRDLRVTIDVTSTRLLASELVALVKKENVSVICIADLPPSPPSKTRYLVKRLRAALPNLRIIVGRWSPPAFADESNQAMKDAGATLVASTMVETREYLSGLVETVETPGVTPSPSPEQPLRAAS